MVTALRTKAQSLKNNADVASIDGLTFNLANGTTETVKFNTDKTWRVKPTENGGYVEIEWKDGSKDYTSLVGSTYTIVEQVQTLDIDPAQVVSYKFDYTTKMDTNVNVESDTTE